MANVECPFCGFAGPGEYEIQLHIEEHHTDDSPFVASSSSSAPKKESATSKAPISSDESMPQDIWTKCSRAGCGEYVLLADVDDHLELHEAIELSQQDSEDERKQSKSKQQSQASSKRDRSPSRRSTRGDDVPRSPRKLQRAEHSRNLDYQSGGALLKYFSGTSHHGPNQRQLLPPPPPRTRRPIREPRQPGRLGKRELGPHAFEDAMPASVRRHLINDAQPRTTQRIGRDGRLYRDRYVENETADLIPILAELCAQDRTTEVTYFCSQSVHHIEKLRCEGNFCGYWNIQMLLSYHHARLPARHGTDGYGHPEPLPNVLQIQETIERAWNNGICSYGRVETGGVKNTRKWIGTHEAVAFFTQAGIKVEALSFRKDEDAKGSENSQPAVLDLLDHIEAYFISGLEGSRSTGTSYITSLPPIYFQRFGHSMTIVGLERKSDGYRNLLVFDPSFETSRGMRGLLAGRGSGYTDGRDRDVLLKAYRRSDLSLSRWEEFEIIVPQPSTAENMKP